MIIVFAILTVLGGAGAALAESRDRPRRRAARMGLVSQAAN